MESYRETFEKIGSSNFLWTGLSYQLCPRTAYWVTLYQKQHVLTNTFPGYHQSSLVFNNFFITFVEYFFNPVNLLNILDALLLCFVCRLVWKWLTGGILNKQFRTHVQLVPIPKQPSKRGFQWILYDKRRQHLKKNRHLKTNIVLKICETLPQVALCFQWDWL